MRSERFGTTESPSSPEKEKSLGIDFFVSDHNTGIQNIPVEQERKLYADMKDHGLSTVRFDIGWKEVLPLAGERDEKYFERYTDILKTIEAVGMKPPTLVISNPPDWAVKLYETDKEKYFEAYEEYLVSVAELIEGSGAKIYSAQLFNEINNATLYKFIDAVDLPRCAQIARRTLSAVQPDIKIATSLIAGNLSDNWPEKMPVIKRKEDRPPVEEYLDQYGPMLKENFDLVQIDYYPGVWHLPVGAEESTAGNLLGRKEARTNPSDSFTPRSLNATLNNFALFKRVAEKLSSLGIPYEIGESGFPTNAPYSTEDRQRFAYDTYFRALRQILVDFTSRGISLPERVGVFGMQDAENPGYGGVIDKILKIPGVQRAARLIPNPENDWGLRKKSGEVKSILQEKRKRLPTKAESAGKRTLDRGDQEGISQLKKIIEYVNRPIDKEDTL
jgi:hypothetical protein